MIALTVLWGKLSLVLILLIGLSMNAMADQIIAGSKIDRAPAAETTENSPSEKTASLNPTVTETVQETLLGDMNLWHFLQQSFELEYSNPGDKLIERFEARYSNHPAYFERVSKRAYWYLPYIVEEIEKRGLPYDLAIIPIVESELRPTAVSTSNAAGLWQFIPSTGERFGLRQDWWVDERKDFIQSTRAALDYLSFLLSEFDNDWELALASYNAGSGRVRKAINENLRAKRPTTYSYLELPGETRSYLPKFVAIRNIISDPERHGVNLRPIPKTATISVIDAKQQTDLALLASLLSLNPDLLKELNPGYLRGVIPPTGRHQIAVPAELAVTLSGTLAKTALWDELAWDIHHVKKGEYLDAIAARYNTKTQIIKRLNNLESDTIYPGQTLRIPITRFEGEVTAVDLGEAGASANSSLQNPKTQSKAAESLIASRKPGESVLRVGDGIYYVRKNDSLQRIASLFGVPLQQLQEMNGMDYSSEVVAGQKLIIRKE